MTDDPINETKEEDSDFRFKVSKKTLRKIKARSDLHGVWFGLGMMGLIGWSIMIPVLIGIAFGVWLDENHSNEEFSWTLVLIVLGLVIGCLNVWLWLSKQRYDT